MLEKYYLFILLAFVSEIIGTISGFGSSILFVPVASMFFEYKEVLGITAVFHVFSNISKIALFRQGIDRDIALKLGIPAIVFVMIGAWMTTFLPTKPMELLMNIVLVGLSVYLLYNFNKTLDQSNQNLYIGGVMSGFLAGLVGTGGAIRGITLAAFQLPKTIFIATSALIDLGVDASRAVIYVSNGYFRQENVILIPFLIGISLAGSYVGKIILRYTSELVFRYIVLSIVVLTSVFQVLKYLTT